MGTRGGSSCVMRIANITVRHQQQDSPRHPPQEEKALRSSRISQDLREAGPRNCCANCNTRKIWTYWSESSAGLQK